MNLQIKVSITDQRKKVGIKELKNLKPCVDYSQMIDNVYDNLEDYNAKVLIVFDDIIAISLIVTENSIKLNISLALISQS